MLLEESTTYQWILSQGEARALRKLLLEMGAERFGPPADAISSTIQGVEDPARLNVLVKRVSLVKTWDELLAAP